MIQLHNIPKTFAQNLFTFFNLKLKRTFAAQFSSGLIGPDYPIEHASKKHIAFKNIKEVVEEDLDSFNAEIKQLLDSKFPELQKMCCYYFDGMGKSIRPTTTFLMSRVCNSHSNQIKYLFSSQRKIALISEMIHISSLVHDDVVDTSIIRRGKNSVNQLCGDKNAVMAGNYIMSIASSLLASIDDCYVTELITTIVDDLVQGEFMQEGHYKHFDQYIQKSYKKTASLIANCCKAVAHLANCSNDVNEAAFQYGSNLGIAFQLIDDMLDFVASSENLGKPTGADLHLGLATAPVFFASEQYPDLVDLIARRFSEPGDTDYAMWAVKQTNSLKDTKLLAKQYVESAISDLSIFKPSSDVEALIQLSKLIVERQK